MTTLKTRVLRASALLASGSLVVVGVPALAAGPAAAATQTITVTASGFVPMNLTIKTGDTIAFTNTDTAAHQVLFKATTGFTCTVTPLVLQPTKTQSCTWTAAGNFPYSDPNQNSRTFRGTVKVEAVTPVVKPTVTLASSAAAVKYGAEATLSGKADPQAATPNVDILAMATGEATYTKIATVPTTNGGAFTLAVSPEIGTSYRAEFQSGATRIVSSVVTVQVRPQVRLTLRTMKGVRAYLRTAVISSLTYQDTYVLVQRKNSRGTWSTVKRVTLGAMSAARFSVRVPSGTSRIRTFLPASQAGTGYLASGSRTLTVTR